MKIFLLEDDFALNKIIKQSLQNRGFLWIVYRWI